MNQDLRAAYRILSQLEKSKALSDRVFDSLPGLYLIIDLQGRIYRANIGAAQVLDTDPEDITGAQFTDYLLAEQRIEFESRLNVFSHSETRRDEFEMSMQLEGKGSRSYHWEMNRMLIARRGAPPLISLIGRDISEFKNAMRSVVELEKDLDFARVAQNLILPPSSTDQTAQWKMAAHYEPASQAGGDWWRYDKRSDGSCLFLLGDVTGHGAGAGMVTAMVAGIYESFVYHNGIDDLHAIFAELNRQLLGLRGQSYWMTLLGINVNCSNQTIAWSCAAAPPAMLLSKDGVWAELGGAGRPLGSGELSILSGENRFEPGDRVFCATDGLLELSPDLSASVLKRGFMRALENDRDNPIAARDRVIKERKRWLKDNQPSDDLAFLIIDHMQCLKPL